jgi:hypothetical protein
MMLSMGMAVPDVPVTLKRAIFKEAAIGTFLM